MTERIVIEFCRSGGWELLLPGKPPRRRHCATRRLAESVAREESGSGEMEVVMRDAYHRVVLTIPAAETPRDPGGHAA